MDMDLIEKHDNTIPAEMIIGLTERALYEEMRHLSFDLIKERHNRDFGQWMLHLCYQEMKRRNADGEIEAASCEIPNLPPDQLAGALLTTNVYSYGPLCETLGKFFDHCHAIFIYQANAYLRAIQ